MADYDDLLSGVNGAIAKLEKERQAATIRMLDAGANAQSLRDELAGDPAPSEQKLAEISQWETAETRNRIHIADIDRTIDDAEKIRDALEPTQDRLDDMEKSAHNLADTANQLSHTGEQLAKHSHEAQHTIATVGTADHPPVGQDGPTTGTLDPSIGVALAAAATANVAKETYDRVVGNEARVEHLIEENPPSERNIQENRDREAIEQADLRSHQIAQFEKDLKAIDEKRDSQLQALEKNTKVAEDRLNNAIEDARGQGNAEEVNRNEEKLATVQEGAEKRRAEIEEQHKREYEAAQKEMERARTERTELEQQLGRDPR